MFRLAPGPEGRIRVQSLNGALELFLIRLYIVLAPGPEGRIRVQSLNGALELFLIRLYIAVANQRESPITRKTLKNHEKFFFYIYIVCGCSLSCTRFFFSEDNNISKIFIMFMVFRVKQPYFHAKTSQKLGTVVKDVRLSSMQFRPVY